MNRLSNRLYLATISESAGALAQRHQLGLELDDFCTAMNFDTDFPRWDARTRDFLLRSDRFILHAPFAELSPCAIDPKVREVARFRLDQAARLCDRYGVRRMVVHSGFIPRVYFPEWFIGQSAGFFRDFLADRPADFSIMIENVLDPDPGVLMEMVGEIGDPRAGVCLDVGHAHVASEAPVEAWLDALAPRLTHLHVHDNDGSRDAHAVPGEGTIGFPAMFDRIFSAAPEATVTFECLDAEGCVRRLIADGLL